MAQNRSAQNHFELSQKKCFEAYEMQRRILFAHGYAVRFWQNNVGSGAHEQHEKARIMQAI